MRVGLEYVNENYLKYFKLVEIACSFIINFPYSSSFLSKREGVLTSPANSQIALQKFLKSAIVIRIFFNTK